MYEKNINRVRIAVPIIMAVCGAGFVISRNLDPGHGTDFGPQTRALGIGFVIGVYACLVVAVGLVVEYMVRSWKGRSLALYELAIVGLLGVLACVAIGPIFVVGRVLCGNVGLDSLAGVLAIGVTACSVATVGLAINGLIRTRHDRRSAVARYEFMTAGLLGSVACLAFAAFLPLRAAEGRRQNEVVEVLKGMHCAAYYDYGVESDGHLALGKCCSWVPNWLLSSAGMDFFHRVVRVDLDENPDPNIDDLLPHLRALTGLKYVLFYGKTPHEKVKQVERALPSCEIRYTVMQGVEFVPWPPPPSKN